MTATNHTEHYELSQYTEDDHPTYTGDYNGDMSKIDAAIHAASQSGGLAAVAHTDDLTGDGSPGNPLGVADTVARSEDIPSLDGYATTESVTQAIAAAIADRLTALESQVAALTAAATPSATGLTASQLDTQYSDDYNIIRTGTPTRNTESEETHNE